MPALRYLMLSIVLIVPDLARAADEPSEPKLGRYNVRSYGASNRPPLFLGHFVLEKEGKYKVYLPGGKLAGEGTYEFDKAKKEVKWLTGKYQEEKWEGRVLLASDDKSLTIWLKKTTRATHVPDEKKDEKKEEKKADKK
jgi:hypothetical protein